ncbi:hypothetical protein C8R44DRAFT_887082 [Mycena epipterygia]|nr:hypothetical protein C8R44DRAFT_887082 [Mycena epipterygia]
MSARRRPAAMQYVDDSAQDADRDERTFDDDASDEDEDSAEAEARRQDARDFDLPSILATHEPRLRASAPYRIPTALLQAGAATPSRGEEIDMGDLPPSRSVSPAFGFGAPLAQMQMSRAATPAYTPAPDALLSIPDSRGATPDLQRAPSSNPNVRAGTPLFLPGSRGPTPYQYDFRTPTPFSRGAFPEHRAGPSSLPQAKRRRIASSSPPPLSVTDVAGFLDTAAEDSDEDNGEEEGEDEDEETLSDLEFIDNEPRHDDEGPPMRLLADHDEEDEEDLHTVATSYDRDASAYERELRRPTSNFAVPDDAPARAGPSTEAFRDIIQSYDHDVRRVGETSRTSQLATLVRTHRAPLIEPMPVGGWIQFTTGTNMGRVAFLLSATKILVARTAEGGNDSCEQIELSRTVDSKQAHCVSPSVEQIAPFQKSRHPVLCAAPFRGACAALGEGDRVVVVGGEHSGKTGYIVMLRDVPVVNESGHRRSAKYAKIQNQYDGTSLIKKRGPGFFVELGRLKRHLLDHPLPLQPLDRVRVVSGLVHRGLLGRAIEISSDQVQVEIPSPSNDTPGLHEGRIPETKCFDINVRYLSRNFECGDLVEVVRGLHENRVGMIVASCTGGGLEIFDRDKTRPIIKSKTQLIRVCHQFKVRSADVKFVIFGDQNTPFASAYSAEYTQRSDISHPQLPPPPIFTPEQRQYREKQAEHYRSTLDIMGEDPGPCDEPTATKFRTLRSFLLHKLLTYTKEPMLEEILLQDKSRQERLDKLMRGHRRFEGYKVQAAFKTSHNKGSRGVVKAERNDRKRDARVASLALRNRRPDLNDVKGIVCHVQWDASNKTEDIPIENLVHQFTGLKLDRAQFLPAAILNGTEPWKPLPRPRSVTPLPDTPPPGEKLWAATPPPPEPTLAGENTGEWLCNEALLNKCLDVVFEGITMFGNRIMRNSPKWPGLDGKTAVLVLATSAPNRRVYKDSLTTKKVKVFSTVADGTSIALVTQRVVIIGPGHFGKLPENIGRYAETRPNPGDAQVYGANYVSVLVEGGDKYLYHTSSLCLAINEAIMESSASVF